MWKSHYCYNLSYSSFISIKIEGKRTERERQAKIKVRKKLQTFELGLVLCMVPGKFKRKCERSKIKRKNRRKEGEQIFFFLKEDLKLINYIYMFALFFYVCLKLVTYSLLFYIKINENILGSE